MEVRKFCPEVFESEGCRLAHALLVGKEEGAVIGVRRGQGVKRVILKSCVPTFIAEDPVQVNQSRTPPLIAPRVFAVLQMYFF